MRLVIGQLDKDNLNLNLENSKFNFGTPSELICLPLMEIPLDRYFMQ